MTMVTANDRLIARLRADLADAGLLAVESTPLWPDEFNNPDAESACKFVFQHVKTAEETTGEALAVPEKPYLIDIAREWHACRGLGTSLHIVKSRRMIVSWFIGALELHLAGCRKHGVVIAAKQFEGQAGGRHFVWRAKFMYDELRKSNLAWRLPEAKSTGSSVARELDAVMLANGSSFVASNSEPGKFRGSGASIVRLEELSAMPYVSALLGQAKTVTIGKPGDVGGFVCSVSNAAYNDEWLDLIERSS